MKNMNKKFLIWLFIIIGTILLLGNILLLYFAMLIDTNSVIDDVKNIMHGNVEESAIDNSPLRTYYRRGDLRTVSVDANITRKFVLHNFSDGYIWVKYTCEGFDSKGSKTYGSWEIPSRWKIHKENGKWKVIEIKERP